MYRFPDSFQYRLARLFLLNLDLRRWGLLEDDGKNIFKLHHDNDDFWSVEYTAKKLNSNQTQTKNNSTC